MIEDIPGGEYRIVLFTKNCHDVGRLKLAATKFHVHLKIFSFDKTQKNFMTYRNPGESED